ncbi:hypothetical protein L1987_54169 [Smallanthus sonchifolius]|uniref:Uncharacterized protein n=1 Tax=Smallanthus sonchifolius TaxID=185202 RepID=A0ACB9E6Q0_9ASTR|nr:hypothetical protein L1987_54169 [Smallanthus sonchifolius]
MNQCSSTNTNGRDHGGMVRQHGELMTRVKRLRPYKPFDPEMLQEFRHPNLVKLIGYCFKDEELFIVHELMHNGNFEDLLRRGVIARLPLVTKVKIAVGIARGIVFLKKIQIEAGDCLERQTILLDNKIQNEAGDSLERQDITRQEFYGKAFRL